MITETCVVDSYLLGGPWPEQRRPHLCKSTERLTISAQSDISIVVCINAVNVDLFQNVDFKFHTELNT